MNSDIKMITDFISNPMINVLSKIDYGKTIAPINERYIKHSLDKENLLHDEEDKDELKNIGIDTSNNGPGFDLYYKLKNKRIQTKFRSVDGVTPFSRQVHFENTRRKSEKNNNSGSKTGHVCYSINEFDYVIVTICHLVGGVRPSYKEWKFCLIPVSELEDTCNIGFCLPHIPANVLRKNACDSIEELKAKLSLI